MNCCQCAGIEREFDADTAQSDLAAYVHDGPDRTSQWLIEAMQCDGVAGLTLLDIGGGVGGIQHALLAAGAAHAVHVDASSAYLTAAHTEAERRGLAGRIVQKHGDLVALAPELAPADLVTLDRVICCYHDMPALVHASAALARRRYGLVFPRDGWPIRLGVRLANLYLRLRGTPFRIFAHRTAAVDALVQSHGLTLISHRRTLFWQVRAYERVGAGAAAAAG